jgi:hypothetical protein
MSLKSNRIYHAWWWMPIIPALGSLKQEDDKFEASLDYIVSLKQAWAT